MTKKPMSDKELDLLLGLSKDPATPEGAIDRLMARVDRTAAANTVVTYSPRQTPHRFIMPWLAGLPLAASLAFGVWLGAAGVGVDLISEGLGGGLAATDDSIFSGIEDAEALLEDNQS